MEIHSQHHGDCRYECTFSRTSKEATFRTLGVAMRLVPLVQAALIGFPMTDATHGLSRTNLLTNSSLSSFYSLSVAVHVKFEYAVDGEPLLSNGRSFAVCVCSASIRVPARCAERGFEDVVCALPNSDWMDLSCMDGRESQFNTSLALSHENVMIIEQIKFKVASLHRASVLAVTYRARADRSRADYISCHPGGFP
ncbi:hypothetical protein KCU89_g25, partial [Aureobasidium melanogenum]